MNDKEYYAQLHKEMEKKRAAQSTNPVEKPDRHKKTVKAFVGKSMNQSVTVMQNNTPITNDDIMNIRIAAETSSDVLDFIGKI